MRKSTPLDGTSLEEPARLPSGLESLDTRVALIQGLIPLGLLAVEEVLQREVELLVGLAPVSWRA